jgi:hypothetical protein
MAVGILIFPKMRDGGRQGVAGRKAVVTRSTGRWPRGPKATTSRPIFCRASVFVFSRSVPSLRGLRGLKDRGIKFSVFFKPDSA